MIIIGVDVSKLTLDLHLRPVDQSFCIANEVKGFKEFLKALDQYLAAGVELLVVMEYTGQYSRKFETFLTSKSVKYCKIPALQIKRSVGIVRGKTDKIDARRISEYAWLRRETLKPDQPETANVLRLKDLLSLRSKLVRDRVGFKNRIKEIKSTQSKNDPFILKMHQRYIDQLKRDIDAIEEQMKAVICSDELLKKNYELITSIKGVGLIVAAYMLAQTNNFTKFKDARKFNCYAGLAPFKHESGTSIKGRSRISHLANKAAKTILNMAACSEIRYNEELKNYYERRIEEGKRKMSCLNIIRAKIVARMFAVVKRQTPYELEVKAA